MTTNPTPLTIERVPTDTLTPHQRNPRNGAHPAALVSILGAEQAVTLTAHLDEGGGDLMCIIPDDTGAWLHAKNTGSKPQTGGGA